MGRSTKFPLVVREQSVAVKIYRMRASTTRDGFTYVVTWVGPDGRERKTITDLEEAREFAGIKAAQLADGIAAGQLTSRADMIELAEVRRLAAEGGMPPLSALSEWLKARQLAGGALVEACTAWSEGRMSAIDRIKVPDAVAALIADKNALGKDGDRVYGSKLKYVADHFGDIHLDTITAKQWSKFLGRFNDAVTRNDVRKRVVTLCRWARRNNHLPEDLVPEIEKTERAKEDANPIGIISPATLRRLIDLFLREDLQRHLGAIIVASYCGVRAEEIHGKRKNPEQRQIWEHIHHDRGFMSVTAAKENTPSNRIVHLTPTAVAWLKICPDSEGRVYPRQSGYVCARNALTQVRKIAKRHGITLPENCLRHSWISYRIARTGDKASTATEAGNSVKEIDRRYRVPLPKHLGEEWEGIRPSDGATTPPPPADRSG